MHLGVGKPKDDGLFNMNINGNGNGNQEFLENKSQGCIFFFGNLP